MKIDFMRHRRIFVNRMIDIALDEQPPARTAQNHFDLIKSGIIDGVTSSTGIFDSEPGDVPEIFDPSVDKFSLADALMRRGASQREVQHAAQGSVQSPAPSASE